MIELLRVRDVAERARVDRATGCPSSVCTRFGLIASFMITVIAPATLQLLGRDRLAVAVDGDDDAAEPRAQILQVARQREHRHDLGRRRDDELVLARDAVRLAAEADDACSAARGRSCRASAAT